MDIECSDCGIEISVSDSYQSEYRNQLVCRRCYLDWRTSKEDSAMDTH